MRSKTSLFNKTVYKKNMALYWPICVCYLLYGLLKVPGTFWSGLRQSSKSGLDTLSILFTSLSMQKDLYVVAAVAVITGMAMFGYLFSSKSAHMTHSLPVTRTELYFTNVISGLTCILVPQMLVFLVTVVMCLTKGLTCVQYPAFWLFGVMSAGIFFYSLVCFCVMLTGLLPAVPVCFVLLGYLSVGIMTGIRSILSFLGYGLIISGVDQHSVSYMLSPLACLTEIVGFRVKYAVDNIGQTFVLAASFEEVTVLLAYDLAALFLYGVALYGYHKRKLEHTGDLLAFGWVRPIFRWGIGAGLGFLAGITVSEFLGSVSVWLSLPAVLALILALGMAGFFIADMLIQKSFRVFCVRRVKESGLFVLALLAGFGILYGIGNYQLKYVPGDDEISCAFINLNYPVELQGDDVKKATDIHRQIIANRRELERGSRTQKNCAYLSLTYCLKKGNIVERTYQIPSEAEASVELAEEVAACEYEEDSFMKYTVGCDYDQNVKADTAQLECRNKNGNYVTYSIDREISEKIYKAFCQDVKEGTIQKYNLENYILDADGTTGQYPSAYLTIYFQHASANWQDVYSTYQSKITPQLTGSWENYESALDPSGSVYVRFGADCRNIIEVLVEEGVVPSKDFIIFSTENQTTMG